MFSLSARVTPTILFPVTFSANHGNGSAYPVGCMSVCLCNAGVVCRPGRLNRSDSSFA